MRRETLIMDLTREQGSRRESQVQPPLAVWAHFFGIQPSAGLLPTYKLVDALHERTPELRKVVKHHHNFTIEIRDARPPRPAILQMQRRGVNLFDYWVLRPGHRDFRHYQWLLNKLGVRSDGERRWVIVSAGGNGD